MSFMINARDSIFKLNTNVCQSQDALWINQCSIWHSYWLQRQSLAVDKVNVQFDDRLVCVASTNGDDVIPQVIEDDSSRRETLGKSLLVDLSLASSNIKSLTLTWFSELRRLDVSFTSVCQLDLRSVPLLEEFIACECSELRQLVFDTAERFIVFVLVGANIEHIDLSQMNAGRHLNLCSSRISSLQLPTKLLPSFAGVGATTTAAMTFLDVSGVYAESVCQELLSDVEYLGLNRCNITELTMSTAYLQCLDVSYTLVSILPNAPLLRALYCEGCPLQEFHLSAFPLLEEANLNSTSLDWIDLSGGERLQILRLSQTLICQLDFSGFNGSLRELDLSESEIARLSYEKLGSLEYLDIYRCAISKIDEHQLSNLKTFIARASALFACDFTKLTHIRTCDVSGTQLQEIDVSACYELEQLDIRGTAISVLDCTGLANITRVQTSDGCVVQGYSQTAE